MIEDPQNPDLIQTNPEAQKHTDPDPQHCFKDKTAIER
jgi:hypothetical protein